MLGLQQGDVVSELRAHTAMVADGERPRAARALLLEFDAAGAPTIYQFGSFGSNRDAIAMLLRSLTILNAKAGN